MKSDDKLKKLLREWRDAEPVPAFESDVWRRIRQAEDKPSEIPGFSLFPEWLWFRPVRVSLAAALVGMLLGGVAARIQPGPRLAEDGMALTFNRPGTLAGSYLQLTRGDR